MNEASKKEMDLFVEDVMDLSDKFSSKAADLSASSMQKMAGPDVDPVIVRNFRMAYKATHEDAYTTGAIESLRLLRGVKEPVEWMADCNTQEVARKLLGDEWLLGRIRPLLPSSTEDGEPGCSEEACPSFDGKRCELEGYSCRSCDPWIDRFGKQPDGDDN
jgi:hypothetical protein